MTSSGGQSKLILDSEKIDSPWGWCIWDSGGLRVTASFGVATDASAGAPTGSSISFLIVPTTPFFFFYNEELPTTPPLIIIYSIYFFLKKNLQ